MTIPSFDMARITPFDFIRDATRVHRQHHACRAYTFEDGPGLIALATVEQPRHVIELGTALGFTACCLASATDKTLVDTIEREPEHVALARQFISDAGLSNRVTVHQGEFRTIMERLTGPYDLAFFDGFAPDGSLVESLGALLRDDGVLICANLALANELNKRTLERMLSDPMQWSRIATLENGSTQAYRKSPQT
jgi:predicted O-methyltransferase YrrM